MKRWSKEELNILKNNFKTVDIIKLEQLLPIRTRQAIQDKIKEQHGVSATKPNGWTSNDLVLLKSHYPYVKFGELKRLFPNKTVGAIRNKASLLGLHRTSDRVWSVEDDAVLFNNYSTGTEQELRNLLPKRSFDSIKIHANTKLRLTRNIAPPTKLGDLTRLLDDNVITYYWLGFLLADGHFSKLNRLVVTLSAKDEQHLKRLGKFLSVKTCKYIYDGYSKVRLAAMDNKVISELKTRYSITSRKTYEPPNLNSIVGDNLFALSIGFIDGDGCIRFVHGRTDCALVVKCHSNWASILETLYGNVTINKRGYAESRCSDNTILREWKQKALDLKLPMMERKWDKIDLQRISQYEITKFRVKIIKQRLEEGVKQTRIAKELGICDSAVSLLIKRKNL